MKKSDNLPAGTGGVGRKVTATRSAGDFILYRPRHSLRIVRAGGNIVKLSIVGSRRTSSRFPHIFHRHGAGTIGVRSEGGTGDQPLFSGPQSRFIKIIGSLNVVERIRCGRSGEPLARHKKVKISALLQVLLGEKVVLLVPLVMFFSTAHRTASAK